VQPKPSIASGDQHHQLRTSASPGVFKQFPVSIRISERCAPPTADDPSIPQPSFEGLIGAA
jgi:hypothetical protein